MKGSFLHLSGIFHDFCLESVYVDRILWRDIVDKLVNGKFAKCPIEKVNQIVCKRMLTDSPLMMEFASFFFFRNLVPFPTLLTMEPRKKCFPRPRSFHLWCLPLWTRSPCPYWARMWYGSYCWDETGRGFAAKCNLVPGQVSTCRWIHGWNSLLWLQDVEKTEPFFKEEDKEGCNTTVFDVSLTRDTVVWCCFTCFFVWLFSYLAVA